VSADRPGTFTREDARAAHGTASTILGTRIAAEERPIIVRSATLLLVAVAISAVSALASGPPYPLLVNRNGLRVYGPPTRPNVCPRLLSLPPHALPKVRRAVALAMPPFEAHLKLNGRDPIVRTVPANRSGFSPVAGGCGQTTWRRSVVAFVRLPHVCCASLSQHTFAVGRLRSGWVLWAWIADVG
jgi:hypothetical protein